MTESFVARSWVMRVALALVFLCGGRLWAAEYRGQVLFHALPVPGATVTATQGAVRRSTTSDREGVYTFADLAEGTWTIRVELPCFAPIEGAVAVTAQTVPGRWELTMLPLGQMMAQAQLPSAPQPVAPLQPAAKTTKAEAAGEAPPPPPKQEDSDGLLVNGSSQNAATSPFALSQAFGNNRPGAKGLYNGGLGLIVDNASLDARPYSLTGLETAKASYNRLTGTFSVGGPVRIPHLLPRGPNFFVAYQGLREDEATIEPGIVPTPAERSGDLSALTTPILDPATGLPFPGNQVPVSAQAAALLRLYPLPNLVNAAGYNYQLAELSSTHQDALQTRLDKSFGRKDQVYGNLAVQSTRSSTTSLFGFTDTTGILGLNGSVNWSHRFSQHLFGETGYRLSRLRTQVTPNFSGRQNVAAAAGIAGTDQDPAEWGPPTLIFASGISGLGDKQSAFNRNLTNSFSASASVYHGHHNVTAGGDLRKLGFNDLFQQDPRGTFAFTGVAGADFASFLLGRPDSSSIAYGNADKYLRQTAVNAYITDDWRLLPILTINAGVRWEYGSPMTEIKNRLVNLDLAPGFRAAAPVLASQPSGSLSGGVYPRSLLRPDYLGIEPRVGISWRPIPGSTVVVRAGYGVYDDTSVYLATTLAMAQQAPLSKSVSVANTAACPLTLANGFLPCATVTQDTFGVDPNFRVGYAQTWQVAVQRDLPGALQATATYLGVKGTRGVQQFLPNTYPIGAANPCPACPAGFVYRTSNGNSTRESGQVQLRRRLRSGLGATLLYTYAKSVDDDAILGGQGPVAPGAAAQPQGTATIAQNWLNLSGERARSTFDQRHLVNLQLQYTTGEGLHGGTLLSGWRGRLLKEWTILSAVNMGSGLPETPVYLATVPGTGFTGTIRPNRTGASVYAAPAGFHLNRGAYSAPTAGQWGTAGRDSITGPGQFSFNTSLARTFRPSKRLFLDASVDATNLLNHPVYSAWNTTTTSAQFGLPLSANPMRSLQTTVRLRF